MEFDRHHSEMIGSERNFGLVFATVFGVIGLWPLIGGNPVRIWSLAIAAVFLVLAFALPAVLRPLNLLWFRFGLLLGRIVAPIVMALIFYVAVTPTALIMRLLGKDLLRLRFDRDAATCWIAREKAPETSMKNQF
ncbi:MAG TPA: SxtJ family membrane protein [Afifellaceae bacterium]|nr:SxtJ family membrane protein [Afifellaceae bacterium]